MNSVYNKIKFFETGNYLYDIVLWSPNIDCWFVDRTERSVRRRLHPIFEHIYWTMEFLR